MSSVNRDIREKQITKKDTARDDFFEIKQEQPSAHWGFHILAGAVCVIFALWVWMLNPIPQIHGDQMNIVTMVLTTKHPDNFARDPVYTGKVAKSYPLLPRLITTGFIKKFGIIGGHRAAQFPLSIAYLFVMYGVLYYLTRSVPGAVLVTLASVIWRWSVGETYWGLDRMQAVQPRSFTLVLMPLLFVLFWKLRKNWWLLVPFFVAGLLFNINPPSALFFGCLSWLSLLLVILYNRNKIPRLRDRLLRLLGGGAAFIAGTLPYLFVNIAARNDTAVELSGQALQEHMDALQYLYRLMAYLPLSTSTLTKVLLVGFSALVFLATIAWCLRKERRNMFDSWLVCFFLLAFVCPVIAQYAMQGIYAHFKTAPPLLDCMRAQKLAYLVLYIYVAWLLAELLRRFARLDRWVLIIVTAMIVAIMPVFGKDSRDPWGQWRYNAGQMKTLLGGEKIEIAGWHNSIANVCNWARQKTPKDSLFLFANRFMDPFRIYALRSLVTSQLAGGIAYYHGPKAVVTWAKYQQEIEWITAKKDISRLLKLANQSKADYIIVSNDFPEVTGWTPVMRDRFWTVYKKP
jgi:hypothetical protein